MSRLQDTGEVKALFRQLIKAAGGVEAAAVELGISFQRVSHLQNTSNADEPTYRQLRVLECIVGKAIVTGSHGKAVEGVVDETLKDAIVGAVQVTSEALGIVHSMDADGVRTEAECRQAQEVTQRMLREVTEAAQVAAQLKPGPIGHVH